MTRRMLIALAAALACPAVVAAQEYAAPPQPHFTIAPFLGYAFTYTQRGTVRFTDAQGTYAADYDRQVQGGWMPGAMVEYHLPGRFGLSAAVAYNKRGEESFTTDFIDVAPLYSTGTKMWFLRGAITMDLAEHDADDLRIIHPSAHLSVGPALVREVPDAASGRPASNAFALNGAAEAELPLPWKGFGVRASFEDYMSYLPRGDIAIQLGADLTSQVGHAFAAELSGGATHLYVMRAGLAYHFNGLSLPHLHLPF